MARRGGGSPPPHQHTDGSPWGWFAAVGPLLLRWVCRSSLWLRGAACTVCGKGTPPLWGRRQSGGGGGGGVGVCRLVELGRWEDDE